MKGRERSYRGKVWRREVRGSKGTNQRILSGSPATRERKKPWLTVEKRPLLGGSLFSGLFSVQQRGREKVGMKRCRQKVRKEMW